MKQPLMLQSECADCKFYEGFGQCYHHGNNLIENCKDFQKEKTTTQEEKELLLEDLCEME